MSHVIYTHGELTAWRDDETGALVVKDGRDGKTYDVAGIAEDPTELAVALMARLMGSGTPADFGGQERPTDAR